MRQTSPRGMRHEEFRIGTEFWCGGRRWRCTDVGTRVVVGVCLAPHEVVTVTGKAGASGTTITRTIAADDYKTSKGAQPLRRPGDQRELRIEAVAGAEVPADLARHDPHRALRHAEGAREVALVAHHAARARVEGVAA